MTITPAGKIKVCCTTIKSNLYIKDEDESKEHLAGIIYENYDGKGVFNSISDGFYALEDISYCPWCGSMLKLEGENDTLSLMAGIMKDYSIMKDYVKESKQKGLFD